MRKVEEKMVNALLSGGRFRSPNTEVTNYSGENESRVYLFGNCIFTYNRRTKNWKADTCGYITKTTKDRLNVILDGVKAGVSIVQRDYKFRIYRNSDGKLFDFPSVLDRRTARKMCA